MRWCNLGCLFFYGVSLRCYSGFCREVVIFQRLFLLGVCVMVLLKGCVEVCPSSECPTWGGRVGGREGASCGGKGGRSPFNLPPPPPPPPPPPHTHTHISPTPKLKIIFSLLWNLQSPPPSSTPPPPLTCTSIILNRTTVVHRYSPLNVLLSSSTVT